MASERRWMCARALAALAALALGACDESDGKEPLPDWSDGYENVPGGDGDGDGDAAAVQFGTYADMEEGSFAIVVPTAVEHPIRIRELGTEDTPCGVAPAEVGGPRREMDCIVEMDELDLFVRGVAFDVVVPEGGCDYLSYHLGMYENYEVGESPTEVSWTVEADGSTTENVNAIEGVPYCPYNYDDRGGPKCCTGAYTQTVTYRATDRVEISRKQWGGKRGDCYDGAAYLDKAAVVNQANGFAMGKYVYPEQEGGGLIEHVETEGLSDHYASTVPLASYVDPDDHDGTVPAALTGDYVIPVAEFFCLDHAEEVRAHLTLVIREWNEEREFDRDGDAETQGMEESWPELPVDDFPDFAELTPGADTWPEMPPKRLD